MSPFKQISKLINNQSKNMIRKLRQIKTAKLKMNLSSKRQKNKILKVKIFKLNNKNQKKSEIYFN